MVNLTVPPGGTRLLAVMVSTNGAALLEAALAPTKINAPAKTETARIAVLPTRRIMPHRRPQGKEPLAVGYLVDLSALTTVAGHVVIMR
jgi:hypothetical protein